MLNAPKQKSNTYILKKLLKPVIAGVSTCCNLKKKLEVKITLVHWSNVTYIQGNSFFVRWLTYHISDVQDLSGHGLLVVGWSRRKPQLLECLIYQFLRTTLVCKSMV